MQWVELRFGQWIPIDKQMNKEERHTVQWTMKAVFLVNKKQQSDFYAIVFIEMARFAPLGDYKYTYKCGYLDS